MNVSVNPNMVTTAFELPGYRVVKSFGLVRGGYGPFAQHFRDDRSFAGNAGRRKHHAV